MLTQYIPLWIIGYSLITLVIVIVAGSVASRFLQG